MTTDGSVYSVQSTPVPVLTLATYNVTNALPNHVPRSALSLLDERNAPLNNDLTLAVQKKHQVYNSATSSNRSG